MPANKDFLPDVLDTGSAKQNRQPTAGRILNVDGEAESATDMQAVLERQQRLAKQTQQLTQRMTAQQDLMASQQKLEKQIEMLTKHIAEQSPPPVAGRPKAGNKQPVQQRRQGDEDEDDIEEDNQRDYRRIQTRDMRGRAYQDRHDVEEDDRREHKRNRGRETRGHVYDDGHDVEDNYHQGHKNNRAREARVQTCQDRYDVQDSSQQGRKRGDYKDRRDGPEEEWKDEENDTHGKSRGHDHHERDEHRHVTSFQRLALRQISMRRDETMKQLHGDSCLHMAAWIAEVITCFLFTCACIVMLSLWARHINEEAFVNTSFVTAIAAMTYFAKACHMGDMMLMGHVVPLARYIDWITTTPLMLYEVCHIAHATASMTIMVIVCDLLMLATGIIAALIPWKKHKGLKQIWFALSCFFFILMLVVIQTDVAYKAKKQIPVAANLFKQLKYLTIIIWSFYPIIVAMGRAHLGLITKSTEDIALCVLDVIAKIGMEGLIVGSCFHGCIEAGGDH